MKNQKTSRKHVKKKKRIKRRTYLDYVFLLLLVLSIGFTLIYVVGLEIPLPFGQKSITMSFLSMNTTFNIYKVYVPRNTLQNNVNLEIGLVIKEATYNNVANAIYLDLGTFSIASDKEITFINTSSHVVLNASKKYFAYLRINRSETNIIVAYIDDKYTKSFNSIVNYYPYQLHFIIRPQKCGVKLSLGNSFDRVLVKSVNEDGSSNTVVIEPAKAGEHYVNLCGDYIVVEGYSLLKPFLMVRYSEVGSYIITRESALIPLIGLSLLFYAFILRFREIRRK